MKLIDSRMSSLVCASLSALTLLAGHAAAQSVVAGPIFSAASGSRYYRIQGGNYTQLRTFARSMGGDLVTINDDAENSLLAATFVTTTKPFIGLNDEAAEGTFAWSDGSTAAFRKCRAGQPANSATKDYVRFETHD